MKAKKVPQYLPLRPRSRRLGVLLVALLVLYLLGLLAGAWRLVLLHTLRSGNVSEQTAALSDRIRLGIGLLVVPVRILFIVAFLAWVYRAFANLRSLGARDLRFSPFWATLVYFVPLLPVLLVPVMMRELWLASDPAWLEPDRETVGPLYREAYGMPGVILGWWLAFLAAWGVAFAEFLQSGPQATAAELTVTTWLDVLHGVLGIVALLVLARLIRRLTGMQEERRRLVLPSDDPLDQLV